MKYTDDITMEFVLHKRMVRIINIDTDEYIDLFPTEEDYEYVVHAWFHGLTKTIEDISGWEDGIGNNILDSKLWESFVD